MHKSKKILSLSGLILLLSLLATSATVFARTNTASSPNLGVLTEFSVLGGAAVTNTGPTITTGKVGVSPGTSLTGFPPGDAGGGTHINDDIAIAAQDKALKVFGVLDQPCDVTLGAGLVELGGMSLVPGVYCAGSFGLNGTLTLTGGAEEVYIFKSATTLIIGSGSEVVGGDPCSVWWRVGSSATLGTNSSFIGNVFSQTGVSAMETGATLDGMFIGLEAVTVTLDSNTISAPICLVPPEEPTDEPTEEPTTPTEEPSASTPAPETLPDTGGDLAGSGSQIIRISLGALGLSMILFGVIMSRRTQKAER